jgi:fructose-bisphosphate aldolase class 1
MKITENYLRSIIRKELRSVLNEIEADEILPRINISPTLKLDKGLSNLIKQIQNNNPTKEDLNEIKRYIAQNVYIPTIFDLDRVDFTQERIKLIDEITGLVMQLGTPDDTGIVPILMASSNLEETVKLIKDQLSQKAKELMGQITLDTTATDTTATEISPTPPAPSEQIDKDDKLKLRAEIKRATNLGKTISCQFLNLKALKNLN